MITKKSFFTLLLMMLFLASFSFAGQNATATAAVDLYTAFPTNNTNAGNTSLSEIGPDTDIYVKIYLKDVSNIVLYEVNLLVDESKLEWVKLLGAADAVGENSSYNEKNILQKDVILLPPAYTFASYKVSDPAQYVGGLRKIQVAGILQNTSDVSNDVAPNGEGLAGIIQLKTKSDFTTETNANIYVKNILLGDNGDPRVEENGLPHYLVAGIVNVDTTEEDDNIDVEKDVATNDDSTEVKFRDKTRLQVKFTGGANNVGKKVRMRSFGTTLPDSMATNTKMNAIKGKTAGYYNIRSTHLITESFQVRIRVKFTAARLTAAGLSNTAADMGKLVLAYFHTGNQEWIKKSTDVNPTLMTAIATVDHFSTWALVDSTDPNVVPVELMSLAARTDAENGVVIEWTTASETNNYGFYIERSRDNISFEEIGFVKGAGNSSYENSYAFTDEEATTIGTYYYRFRQVDFDGSFAYSSIVSAAVKAPNKYSLFWAYPNPFNPATTIKFSLKESGLVKITVYNTLGQLVSTLVNEELDAGQHKVMFDAGKLASGIYFYKMEVNGFTDTKKMIFVK